MDTIARLAEQVRTSLDITVFTLGQTRVTLWSLAYLTVLIILLFYVTARLQRWAVERLLRGSNVHIGVRHAIATIVRYLVLLIGLIVALQATGIDLTAVSLLAGGLGLGVGFGLQNVVSNFISGLIILFERPVKIGDRIEVGGVEGDVVEIRARSTTVMTNDNIAIIIPNSKFVTENVVNWSYRDESVRFRIPVSVAYGSDVRLVEELLLRVASESPDVLGYPAPVVRFLSFGESGLDFDLRAWSTSLVRRKGKLISSLNFAIYDEFRKNNIQIPFPQRDVHIHAPGGGWTEGSNS